MDTQVIEAQYPFSFRKDIAKTLGEHLQHQHSVELVGMKRVGINNFLRFFLFHEGIKKEYMPQDGKHFFILVDLNDLIEREMFPFWRLTFKRIVDAVEGSLMKDEIKKKISDLFVACIQSGDLFLTYDGVREALNLLVRENIYPTLFLTRFDRLKDAVTPEFFNNLQALKDATHQKLSYVFTSYRELDTLVPSVFHRKELSLFSNIMYMPPATVEDSKIVLETIKERYSMQLPETMEKDVIAISGGHVQYLQLSLLVLHEHGKKLPPTSDLEKLLLADERITLQSEELWESLSEVEKTVLLAIAEKKPIAKEEKEQARYLWDTGFVAEQGKGTEIFSSLFQAFALQQIKRNDKGNSVEFSKKEHLLFQYLEEHLNDICEREVIVDVVWPEYKEYGVSDWSIDRLVARVRGKLRKQKSMYEIVTIRTRGYKLIPR